MQSLILLDEPSSFNVLESIRFCFDIFKDFIHSSSSFYQIIFFIFSSTKEFVSCEQQDLVWNVKQIWLNKKSIFLLLEIYAKSDCVIIWK